MIIKLIKMEIQKILRKKTQQVLNKIFLSPKKTKKHQILLR